MKRDKTKLRLTRRFMGRHFVRKRRRKRINNYSFLNDTYNRNTEMEQDGEE